MPDFVHLHCHTEFSLLDGAIRIKDLCAKTKEFGSPAVAITDHGNMHGAVDFYMKAKDCGIKPILGCEVYVAGEGGVEEKGPGAKRHHLVLLAKDLTGYHNLLKLVSKASLHGFHYKPRVDKTWLMEHAEGLIALSACLAGEIPRVLMGQGLDAGIRTANEYAQIFPGRFYLEMQANGLEEQFRANELIRKCADATGLPLVATNDCHYLTREDVEAHDVLLCIQTAAMVSDKDRMRFGTSELYYRPPQEMAREFSDCPEALENTLKIADMCSVDLNLKQLHFPKYDLPAGMTLEDEFRKLSRDGLRERLEKLPYKVDEQAYWRRFEYELDVICKMQFPGYFLIVQDFINWAKREAIPVGPGRGSAAGSIVAWALKITNLDPIPYNLLFERFLNVERISMPDIDVDFCERRRHEVIDYVTRHYGEDNVAQITTFGTMKAKAAVKDVGRALGMSFAETNRIAKLIPEDLKMTIGKALDSEQELRNLYDLDPHVRKCLDVSIRLEGLCRHCSTHAAGVVISPGPMSDYLPLYRDKKGGVVTQYDMKKVEKVGLVKFDFLGLRTMTVIHDTLDNIRLQGLTPPDLDVLPLDDLETYKLYSRGDTDGIFQVESSGMRKYLQMLKPSCFEDIIAMLALYRPGPLGSGMVDEFIKRKHGEVAVTFPHESLSEVLKPTYGVIVYQEQVMSVAQIMAGYTLGQADLLRRAMGKKNPEEMAKQRERFLSGAREKKIADATANEVFDLMEKFAEYGFNKSHSAAYALISYHTAYLKVHHKHEFMAAIMTSEIENQDKILKYINSCRDMEIKVLPPDVNASLRQFTVEQGRIRYGLGGVKNVGDEAIKDIVAARETDGPFRSLLDLCCRANLRKVTKRVLESLIKAGAVDGFGATRAALIAGLDRAVGLAQKKQKERESGQISMLGLMGTNEREAALPGLGVACPEQSLDEWPDDEKLRNEKEALGFYLSSHPLLAFRHELRRLRCSSLEDCAEMGEGMQVKVALLITGVKEHITKRGDKMAFCQAEDLTGATELVMFPEVYQKAKPHMEGDQPLLVTAKISEIEGGDGDDGEASPKRAKLLAEDICLLSGVVSVGEDPVELYLPRTAFDSGRMDTLKAILARYPGRAPVQFELTLPEGCCRLRLGPRYTVAPTVDFWKEIEGWRTA
ncbi:DNA polymerase III, alpha subunit [Desulfocurvibacter africanus PCS]|uniref:DNA polymerase III subunit alpha n=1 Tax=Desulfocurvibacter africanus PCS TaxID=1262666 RepID=M5PNZ8_DESAF|nr:DNA polymerase III subunit alpha [Desulfocurvibacter africanus]EMG35664.1 DNA polymerase III, alpha subunit [Desulfocurvibacter africanus PCS]